MVGNAISIAGRASSCNATSVLVASATNREREWLGMVMGAVRSEKALNVYGVCNARVADRIGSIVVEYRS
jgi:hypothetical protein